MTPLKHTATPVTGPPALSASCECLVFALGDQTYAIVAEALRLCLSLPRLTVLDDAPPYLIGAFDLGGDLAPVVSPSVLSGLPLQPAKSGDLVVVIEWQGYPIALHADTMLGIEPLRAAAAGDGAAASRDVALSGGRALLIDPSRISVAEALSDDGLDAGEARLDAFECQLDAAALRELEHRARRYGSQTRPTRDFRALRISAGPNADPTAPGHPDRQ